MSAQKCRFAVAAGTTDGGGPTLLPFSFRPKSARKIIRTHEGPCETAIVPAFSLDADFRPVRPGHAAKSSLQSHGPPARSFRARLGWLRTRRRCHSHLSRPVPHNPRRSARPVVGLPRPRFCRRPFPAHSPGLCPALRGLSRAASHHSGRRPRRRRLARLWPVQYGISDVAFRDRRRRSAQRRQSAHPFAHGQQARL